MNTSRRNPLEPVEEAADLLARRQQAREVERATESEESETKKGRDRSWDAQRSKATYDLPPELIERIRMVADDMAAAYPDARVRISDVARLLLETGLAEYDAGNISVSLKPVSFVIFDD